MDVRMDDIFFYTYLCLVVAYVGGVIICITMDIIDEIKKPQKDKSTD